MKQNASKFLALATAGLIAGFTAPQAWAGDAATGSGANAPKDSNGCGGGGSCGAGEKKGAEHQDKAKESCNGKHKAGCEGKEKSSCGSKDKDSCKGKGGCNAQHSSEATK